MRGKPLLFVFSAFFSLAPALWLRVPAHAGFFATSEASQQNWQLGLAGALLLLSLASWRLNQNRLVAVALGLLLAAGLQWLAQQLPLHPLISPETAWLFCVPSGLSLALLPKEGRLLGRRSLLRLLLLFLPAFLLWAVYQSDPASTLRLLDWRAGGPGWDWQPSHAAHASLLILGLILWRGFDPKLGPAQLALGGSLLGQTALAWASSAYAPISDGALLESRVWLASHLVQAACLLFALFLMYWQRVYLDELTGIPNRRALDERLSHLDGPYSLAMVDIDHFKKFNDSYGHDQGDDVLRLVGKHLAEGTQGRAFRYGGEEFCVLFPGRGSEESAATMDGVRASLAKHRFIIRLPKKIRAKTGEEDRGSLRGRTEAVKVTISVGVAQSDKKRSRSETVLKLADEGLYKAKEAGRNNVQAMN